MKNRYLGAVVVFLVFFACTNSNKKQEEKDDKTQETISYLPIAYKVSSASHTKLDLLIDFDFGNTIVEGKNTIEGLQEAHNNIFDVEEIKVDNSDMLAFTYRLTYKDSYIKIYHNDFQGAIADSFYNLSSDDIVSAVIKDRAIQMQNGIRIGMSKKDFFIGILANDFANSIDTVHTGDEQGDIEHQFIFKDNKLDHILITSTYDFADFNFHKNK